MPTIPDVLQVSQMGEGATLRTNDCGPACCAMILHKIAGISLNPDDFYSYMTVPNDSGTFGVQLAQFLNEFDVGAYVLNKASMVNLLQNLEYGRISIWLVAYKPLVDAGCTQFRGDFMHWVTVVGYENGKVLINDPYRTDGKSYIAIPETVFIAANAGSAVYCPQDLIGGGTVVTQKPVNYRVVSSCPSLNVRSGPSTGNTAIGQLKANEEIHISDITNQWGKVEGPRLWGWCYIPYLEKLAEVVPPSNIPDSSQAIRAARREIWLEIRNELNVLGATVDSKLKELEE